MDSIYINIFKSAVDLFLNIYYLLLSCLYRCIPTYIFESESNFASCFTKISDHTAQHNSRITNQLVLYMTCLYLNVILFPLCLSFHNVLPFFSHNVELLYIDYTMDDILLFFFTDDVIIACLFLLRL